MAKKAGKEIATREKGGAIAKGGDYKKELAKYAKDEAAREPAGAGGDYISIRGKNFSFKGDTLSEPLKVIILNYSFENAYYTEKFDPENPAPPVCFALSMNQDDMAPHETSPEPQSEVCKDCPQNEWGSGDGRGKACKNNRRLAVINADVDKIDQDYIKKATVALLRLPPTSVKHFRGYVKKITEGLKQPLWSVVTALSFDEDEAHPVVVPQFEDDIDDRKVLRALADRHKEVVEQVLAPFDVSSYEGKGKGKGKPVKGKDAAKTKKKRNF